VQHPDASRLEARQPCLVASYAAGGSSTILYIMLYEC
jgi:hypothetical protein